MFANQHSVCVGYFVPLTRDIVCEALAQKSFCMDNTTSHVWLSMRTAIDKHQQRNLSHILNSRASILP